MMAKNQELKIKEEADNILLKIKAEELAKKIAQETSNRTTQKLEEDD